MRPSVLPTALAIAALLAAMAIPVTATDPGSDAPLGVTEDRAERDEQPLTVAGTIATSIHAEGSRIYTLHGGTQTYILEAGPSWYWGDDHPLGAYVGMDVTISGERPGGSSEVDVLSIDGTALREAGKPPWAGGWKRVGELHPGWTQAKADRSAAKRRGLLPTGPLQGQAGQAPGVQGSGPPFRS